MTRPMLLPARDAEERVATSERTMSPGTPINTYHVVQVPIRNAGSGPALGAALATALPSVDPWQAMEFVSAIAVDDEVVVEVPVFGGSGGGLPPSVTLYIQYGDLGGATYATNIELHLAAGATKRVGRVDLVEGKALYRQIFPSTKPNLTRYRRPPLGPRLRAAADRLFLKPGDPIEPLRPRIRSAWAAIRPPRRQSYVQRFRWALQADRMNRGPGGPYSGTPIHAQYAAIGYWGTPWMRRKLWLLKVRFQRMRWAWQ